MAAWASISPRIPEPSRVIMPWSEQWTDRWGLSRLPGIKQKDWRDQYGINPVIIEGMFPDRKSLFFPHFDIAHDTAVVEREQWERLAKGDTWVYFERGKKRSSFARPVRFGRLTAQWCSLIDGPRITTTHRRKYGTRCLYRYSNYLTKRISSSRPGIACWSTTT